MNKLFMHVNSKTRLRFVEYTGMGKMAIFENVDCPYVCRTTCPLTPEFVVPYHDVSAVIIRRKTVRLTDEFYAGLSALRSFHGRSMAA